MFPTFPSYQQSKTTLTQFNLHHNLNLGEGSTDVEAKTRLQRRKIGEGEGMKEVSYERERERVIFFLNMILASCIIFLSKKRGMDERLIFFMH